MDPNLKIAIVEDNDDLRSILIQDISIAGYFVQGADSAKQLDELFAADIFDILIADVNLPGEDGFSIAARYKKYHPHLAIVMLTARTAVEDKVGGYEAGADLYLTKPVSNFELLAAIGSIARRVSTQKPKPEIVLNLKNMTLTAAKTVDLNRQEVLIVKALSESSSSNLPYYQLLEICSEPVDETSKATLEVRIARLRKKFVEAGVDKSLRALRGDGYQLLVDIHIVL
ncbi:response regulator transcription factor [Polynucleobacter sp. MG-27-Goln-C1]|uniref:response regulator transcription factor n=1 Tax=Polynucleobacter sp. MG-27-Goln-C1 TaxID=1819726 RepID=UPI001C0E8468|nr:response regulator transcription factor [Polynucleobacter sp. MG-27-Goln-C1]MBU3612134.1 response regulator transcription factor [Polynucleobacter sp. MG-27-Goln-C1]